MMKLFGKDTQVEIVRIQDYIDFFEHAIKEFRSEKIGDNEFIGKMRDFVEEKIFSLEHHLNHYKKPLFNEERLKCEYANGWEVGQFIADSVEKYEEKQISKDELVACLERCLKEEPFSCTGDLVLVSAKISRPCEEEKMIVSPVLTPDEYLNKYLVK